MPERAYKHRDVLDKLGIKPGDGVAIAVEADEIDPDLCQRMSERVGHPGPMNGKTLIWSLRL